MVFWPHEDVSFDAAYDESQLDGGVDAYLEAQEARVLNIRDNSEKRVIWAGAVEVKTPLAIVCINGFLASSK